MKYILLVGDGMADRPLDELDGLTVLEKASTRNMDAIVSRGRIGAVSTVPKGMHPASDVANLNILGYDPKKYYMGRGPLEAANMGIDVALGDVAFRLNTVTVSDGKMVDYSAGHITTKESSLIIKTLAQKLGTEYLKFYPGVSYRHLVVLHTGSAEKAAEFCKVKCTPPHDIVDKEISRYLPNGKGAEEIVAIMNRSNEILENHEVNKVRIDLKENPANMAWLWGQGAKPRMESFKAMYGVNGAVISAVDLINGIGKLAGLEVIKVPGATGYYDTDYKAKAEYALKALKDTDFVFVHVEAPDEAGHNGDVRAKIAAIENFDRLVVGTIWEQVKDKDNFRIMVLPDHATPVKIRSHTDEPVPFAVCGRDVPQDSAARFSEAAAKESEFIMQNASGLMKYLIKLEEK